MQNSEVGMEGFEHQLFEQEGLHKTLGIEPLELQLDRVVARMPITSRHQQPFGYLHGGASVALAETVASTGGFLNSPADKATFGIEINANHLRSKRSGHLIAVGTPVHIDESNHIWEVRIVDEDEQLICISRCTLAVVEIR